MSRNRTVDTNALYQTYKVKADGANNKQYNNTIVQNHCENLSTQPSLFRDNVSLYRLH